MVDNIIYQMRYRLWLAFVERIMETIDGGASLPTGPSKLPSSPSIFPPPPDGSKKIFVCSPHPDDEALVGALPLRLRSEANCEIVNCAVTLGGDRTKRRRRLEELRASCNVLGFRLIVLNYPHGLDDIRPETREASPSEWLAGVRRLAEILIQEKPRIVILPHAQDFHPTHIGTHHLTIDALRELRLDPSNEAVILIETEYWHELSEPNLMVGVTPEMEAVLVMATAEHGGEVARNPYHIRHPARLIDNVRRGSEVVAGTGSQACDFMFGELYRVSLMRGHEVIPARKGGLIIGPTEKIDVDVLFSTFCSN